MFGSYAQSKTRKITTYGKASRQPSFAYKNFLEASPEKRKTQVVAGESHGRATTQQRSDPTWDLSSDEQSEKRVAPVKSRPNSAVVSASRPQASKSAVGTSKARASESSTGKQKTEVEEQAAERKRKREDPAARQNIAPQKDIFEFPDDIDVAPVLSLPTRSRAKTPSAATRSTNTSTTTSRSRKNTPEPSNIQRTPQTARKITTDMDIYDIPDDDIDRKPLMKTKPRPATVRGPSPSPARKRQMTPAREVRIEETIKAKVKSRATTLQRSHPAKPVVAGSSRKREIISPKSSTFSGVLKRKVAKGSSAPSSLWSMIREPPSPPADSSDSAASPASPGFNSKMEIEPAMTPATPPNRASASPMGLTGSVTPKQKQLWAQLLGDDETDSPNELPMSNLQLESAVKVASRNVASLARSSSDVPQTAATRRRRLVDTLKSAEPTTEAEEMDLDDGNSGTGSPSHDVSSQSSRMGPPRLRSELSFRKTSAKVTYGQGRTYLEEKSEDKIWDMLAAEEPSQTYSAYGSQSQNSIQDDVDMEENSQPRTAHDLRAAGSRRRLHDELSSFIMDIEQRKNSTSIRRSALRDLTEKLLEKESATCFVETGLDSTFLAAVEHDSDLVSLFLQAGAIVSMVAADPTPSVLDHVFHSQTFTNILKLLDLGGSLDKLVKDRKANIAKMSQAMILELRDALLAADIWGSSKPRVLTPQILGLHCVEMIVRKLREHGSSYTLLVENVVKQILSIARAELTCSNLDIAVVETAFSALQVNTVSAPSMRNKIWPPALVQMFADMLPLTLALLDREATNATQIVQLSLKLAVELTNHNTAACDAIGTPAVVMPLLSNANQRYTQLLDHQAAEDYAVVFDFTVLAFGLTINLTEVSDAARLAMLEDGGAALKQAIQLFTKGKQRADDAESLEDTQMNVIYGCLAFTLGNLSRNDKLREVVASQFPTGNLDAVLEAMQEFAAINRLADKKEFEGEEGNEVSRNFTERLQTVLDEVKALNG